MIEKVNTDFVEFEQMEEQIKAYLNRFSHKYLNTIAPFDIVLPTIENMGNTFYNELSQLLQQNGYRLLRLGIGETPCSIFSVSESLFVGSLLYDEYHPSSRLITDFIKDTLIKTSGSNSKP